MTGFYGNDDGGDDDGDGNSEYHDDEYCCGPFVYEKLPWGFFGNDDDDFPSKWPAFFEDEHENINTEQKYDLISLSCSHMCLNLNAVFFFRGEDVWELIGVVSFIISYLQSQC